MDNYDRKFKSMQLYVPFLEKMIVKLEAANDRGKEPHLNKIKSLHVLLTDTSKKVRYDTLCRCEDVLMKLYEKVEGDDPPVQRNREVEPARNTGSGRQNDNYDQSFSSYLQTLHDQQSRDRRAHGSDRGWPPSAREAGGLNQTGVGGFHRGTDHVPVNRARSYGDNPNRAPEYGFPSHNPDSNFQFSSRGSTRGFGHQNNRPQQQPHQRQFATVNSNRGFEPRRGMSDYHRYPPAQFGRHDERMGSGSGHHKRFAGAANDEFFRSRSSSTENSANRGYSDRFGGSEGGRGTGSHFAAGREHVDSNRGSNRFDGLPKFGRGSSASGASSKAPSLGRSNHGQSSSSSSSWSQERFSQSDTPLSPQPDENNDDGEGGASLSYELLCFGEVRSASKQRPALLRKDIVIPEPPPPPRIRNIPLDLEIDEPGGPLSPEPAAASDAGLQPSRPPKSIPLERDQQQHHHHEAAMVAPPTAGIRLDDDEANNKKRVLPWEEGGRLNANANRKPLERKPTLWKPLITTPEPESAGKDAAKSAPNVPGLKDKSMSPQIYSPDTQTVSPSLSSPSVNQDAARASANQAFWKSTETNLLRSSVPSSPDTSSKAGHGRSPDVTSSPFHRRSGGSSPLVTNSLPKPKDIASRSPSVQSQVSGSSPAAFEKLNNRRLSDGGMSVGSRASSGDGQSPSGKTDSPLPPPPKTDAGAAQPASAKPARRDPRIRPSDPAKPSITPVTTGSGSVSASSVGSQQTVSTAGFSSKSSSVATAGKHQLPAYMTEIADVKMPSSINRPTMPSAAAGKDSGAAGLSGRRPPAPHLPGTTRRGPLASAPPHIGGSSLNHQQPSSNRGGGSVGGPAWQQQRLPPSGVPSAEGFGPHRVGAVGPTATQNPPATAFQPRNYKEYRMMKEEAERRQRAERQARQRQLQQHASAANRQRDNTSPGGGGVSDIQRGGVPSSDGDRAGSHPNRTLLSGDGGPPKDVKVSDWVAKAGVGLEGAVKIGSKPAIKTASGSSKGLQYAEDSSSRDKRSSTDRLHPSAKSSSSSSSGSHKSKDRDRNREHSRSSSSASKNSHKDRHRDREHKASKKTAESSKSFRIPKIQKEKRDEKTDQKDGDNSKLKVFDMFNTSSSSKKSKVNVFSNELSSAFAPPANANKDAKTIPAGGTQQNDSSKEEARKEEAKPKSSLAKNLSNSTDDKARKKSSSTERSKKSEKNESSSKDPKGDHAPIKKEPETDAEAQTVPDGKKADKAPITTAKEGSDNKASKSTETKPPTNSEPHTAADHEEDAKDKLTKELLKSIVASLDQDEARQLLAKASELQSLENLTLRQLKDLLTIKPKKAQEEVKADATTLASSEPPQAKKASKKNNKRQPPTKATKTARRSGRLQKATDDSTADVEDDDSQPGGPAGPRTTRSGSKSAAAVAGRRIRSEITSDDDDDESGAIQDASITSSNIEDMSSAAAKDAAGTEEANTAPLISSISIKEEPVDDTPENDDASLRPTQQVEAAAVNTKKEKSLPAVEKKEKMKTMRLRMAASFSAAAAKSRAWYMPSTDGIRTSMVKQEVKEEPKEVDAAVFLGDQESTGRLLQTPYEYGPDDVEMDKQAAIKERHGRVTDILARLDGKRREITRQHNKEVMSKLTQKSSNSPTAEVESASLSDTKSRHRSSDSNKSKLHEPLPSKVKLHRPPLDPFGRQLPAPQLLPTLDIKPLSATQAHMGSLVNALRSRIGKNVEHKSNPVSDSTGVEDDTHSRLKTITAAATAAADGQQQKTPMEEDPAVDDLGLSDVPDLSSKSDFLRTVRSLALVKDRQRKLRLSQEHILPILSEAIKKPADALESLTSVLAPDAEAVEKANPGQGYTQDGQLASKAKTNVQRPSLSAAHTRLIEDQYKNADTMKTMLEPASLKLLFKCMNFNCPFATDCVDTFKSHLEENHQEEKFGRLRCCYCLGKAERPVKLLRHIISKHSSAQYQCTKCFVRVDNLAELRLHNNIAHAQHNASALPEDAAEPFTYLLCRHLPSAPSETATVDNSTHKTSVGRLRVPCPKAGCGFRAAVNAPSSTVSSSDGDANLRPLVTSSALFKHFRDDCKEFRGAETLRSYVCTGCDFSTSYHPGGLLLHHLLTGHGKAEVTALTTDVSSKRCYLPEEVPTETESSDVESSSSDDEDENDAKDIHGDVSSDSEMSNFDKNFYDEDIDSIESTLQTATAAPALGQDISGDSGYSGHALYRCANDSCTFSAATASHFKDHATVCELGSENGGTFFYSCYHCEREFKHVPTLLEHLKAHAVKRFFCGLCDYRGSVVSWTKSHIKLHKVTNFKMVPLIHNKNNPDEDMFVLLPKNSVVKALVNPSTPNRGRAVKDTFYPSTMDTIPLRPEILRNLIRCGLCEFSTKVRGNLIKHLKLHKEKEKLVEDGEIEVEHDRQLPMVGPVNPPPVDNMSNYNRMKSLLSGEEEEDLCRQLISDEDLKLLPKFVPENLRYACCYPDCNYITIDEMMLAYHIRTLHHDLVAYDCPHCIDTSMDMEDISFHLKCHGDLLFKCGHCFFHHWQKRTADKHVAEAHPELKQFIRNVREDEKAKEEERQRASGTAAGGGSKSSKKMGGKAAGSDAAKGSAAGGKQPLEGADGSGEASAMPTVTYEPFKCTICDSSFEQLDAVLAHCKEVHEQHHQWKCGLCVFSSNFRPEVEAHFSNQHPGISLILLKSYMVDPTTTTAGRGSGIAGDSAGGPVEKPVPLWHRQKDDVKHIRGILYEDESQLRNRRIPPFNLAVKGVKRLTDNSPTKQPLPTFSSPKRPATNQLKHKVKRERFILAEDHKPVDSPSEGDSAPEKVKKGGRKTGGAAGVNLDAYKSTCKECGVKKDSVSGMKLHIRFLHLKEGRFRCRHCDYTGGLRKSIIGHYRSRHPDARTQVTNEITGLPVEEFDFLVVKDQEKISYSQEWWKENWNIPSITERKQLFSSELYQPTAKKPKTSLKDTDVDSDSESDSTTFHPGKKKHRWVTSDAKENAAWTGKSAAPRTGKKAAGRKRKIGVIRASGLDGDASLDSENDDRLGFKIIKVETSEESPRASQKAPGYSERPPTIEEMSPFESVKTYMCALCPRRSQSREMLQRHHTQEHARSQAEFECRELSRDQVVSLITSDHYQPGNELEYKCFYCHSVGDIMQLRDHTKANHQGQSLRVNKFQKKVVSGYLECQICGYLSPGFDKSHQKVHFHDEHPLEVEVKCSKYMSKSKPLPEGFLATSSAMRFTVQEVDGMVFVCPRSESCSYQTKTLSQINSHLRKHTRTYKCGHCGRTLPDSSEFHQHSALSHGDKIPDLVKDPEAEAEYEGLKALLELAIHTELAAKKAAAQAVRNTVVAHARAVARKSTTPDARAGPGDRRRNVAAKSTGPASKYWPETRITEPYSFYGRVLPPLDPRLIKTRVNTGGTEVTLDVAKMGQLFNLTPELKLKDCARVSISRDELCL